MDESQTSHLTNQQSAALWQDVDRRHVGRTACGLGGVAKSVEQTRPQPVLPGRSFPVTISEISGTGLRLYTPHELGVGDLLEVTADALDGAAPLCRAARVVWVGQTSQAQWCAGAEFTD